MTDSADGDHGAKDARGWDKPFRKFKLKLLRATLFFFGLTVFGVVLTVLSLKQEVAAETQLPIGVMYSEAAAESAKSLEDLEAARSHFLKMLQLLITNLESRALDHSLLFNPARNLCIQTVEKLGEVADRLQDAEVAPDLAIKHARDSLKSIYQDLDGAIPITNRLGNLHSGNSKIPVALVSDDGRGEGNGPPLSPVMIDQLARELKHFDRAVKKMRSEFPQSIQSLKSDQSAQDLCVANGVDVCQWSRLSMFLLSLEWESRLNSDSDLVTDFIRINEEAKDLCIKLRDALPQDSKHKQHVKEYCASIGRRVKVASAYEAGDWDRVVSLVTLPLELEDTP